MPSTPVAVTLLHGAAGLDEFSDCAVAGSVVAALRAKVAAVEADDEIPVESAVVTITCKDGATHEFRIDRATGTPDIR